MSPVSKRSGPARADGAGASRAARRAGRTHFLCRACGATQPKWLGKCPECGAWDALERFTEPEATSSSHESLAASWLPAEVSDGGRSQADTLTAGEGQAINRAQPLADVPLDDLPRMPTGLGEFDRVLGGGLVPGSVVLLGGDPGIGKSTLLLQALALLGGERSAPEAPRSVSGRPILYVSSEESARQVRLRAERLVGIHSEQPPDCAASPARGGLYILAETNLARIGEQIRRLRPAICAIDSIQMIHRPDVDAAAGSVSQVRRCCADLVYLAKRSGMPILVVGHVTKDGQLAGPKLLEHLVDVVLSFEGDRHHGHRIVRATKNRFGSTHEIGLFEMTGAGLRELTEGLAGPDPLRAPAVGTAVCPALLGSRCLLAEVEALTATGVLGNAKRKSSGLDASRLAMLIAVLEKHGGLRLADQDVFAAAAGGLRVTEPAADLALSLAIAGAHYRRALPPASVAIGEVGLPGRLRSVPQMHVRVREALRRGFRCIILPKVSLEEGMPPHPPGALVPVESVAEALAVLITPADSRREARGVPGPRSGGLHAT